MPGQSKYEVSWWPIKTPGYADPLRLFLLTGKKGTGKTTAVCCILRSLRKHFRFGFVITPNAATAERMHRTAGLPRQCVFTTLTPEIQSFLMSMYSCADKIPMFLFLDDMSSDKIMKSEFLTKLVSMCRHVGVGIFITSQQPKHLPPNIRGEADYTLSFRDTIPAHRKILQSEYFGLIDARDFGAVHEQLTRHRHALVADNISQGSVSDSIFVWRATSDKDLKPFKIVSPKYRALIRIAAKTMQIQHQPGKRLEPNLAEEEAPVANELVDAAQDPAVAKAKRIASRADKAQSQCGTRISLTSRAPDADSVANSDSNAMKHKKRHKRRHGG
jgi:hypothetical protein